MIIAGSSLPIHIQAAPVVFLWVANQRKIRTRQMAHMLHLVCLSSLQMSCRSFVPVARI